MQWKNYALLQKLAFNEKNFERPSSSYFLVVFTSVSDSNVSMNKDDHHPIAGLLLRNVVFPLLYTSSYYALPFLSRPSFS